MSYPGPQTNPSAITSSPTATHRSHCRRHGHETRSTQTLEGVRLKSRFLATRRLVIGLIIIFSLRIYPPVTPHMSASVRIWDVVCVRIHEHQTSCLLWAANQLLVFVSKFPELSAQRTESGQVQCHCSRQNFTIKKYIYLYSHLKSPLTSRPKLVYNEFSYTTLNHVLPS